MSAFKYICVLDFEATCDNQSSFRPNEVIEFPVVVLQLSTSAPLQLQKIAEFRHYVKPTINPILTPFCTNLTGISQHQVENAELFPTVLCRFEDFLCKSVDLSLSSTTQNLSFIFLTCGDWDLKTMLPAQLRLYGHQSFRPCYFNRWINIKT
jgi:inhibitor of KinA sporulation pathway (predicted exonuclease)